MTRKLRFFLPGIPAHIVQRGNNRQSIFFEDDDRRAYLGWLKEAAGRRYVPYTNRSHGRTGTLWDGRFKASMVQSETYLGLLFISATLGRPYAQGIRV